MAITVKRPDIPSEEERKKNPFGRSISNPDTSTPAVSTKVAKQTKTQLNNREAIDNYYGTEDAKRIAQLPGMARAGVPVDVVVDPGELDDDAAAGKYTPLAKEITLRHIPLDLYANSTVTHELSHQLFDTQGQIWMKDHQKLIDQMPTKYRKALGNTPIHELAAELLTEVRMGIKPTPDASLREQALLKKYMDKAGSLEGALALLSSEGVDLEDARLLQKQMLPNGDIYVQRSVVHPALHPEGIDKGVDALIESLSKSTATAPGRAARIAKEYKPMRDYIKWLFSTYGANDRVVDTGDRYILPNEVA